METLQSLGQAALLAGTLALPSCSSHNIQGRCEGDLKATLGEDLVYSRCDRFVGSERQQCRETMKDAREEVMSVCMTFKNNLGLVMECTENAGGKGFSCQRKR